MRERLLNSITIYKLFAFLDNKSGLNSSVQFERMSWIIERLEKPNKIAFSSDEGNT